MPFTKERFAEKLKNLRTDFGETPENLCAATGIQLDKIHALESALVEPSGDEVLIFSDYFKCEISWLVDDETPNADENLRILFRSKNVTVAPSDRHAIKEFIHLCKSQAFLEKLLERQPPKLGFNYKPKGSYFIQQGKDCAQALRAWNDLPANAIMPDIYNWLRKIGLRVFRRPLPNSGISGLFIQHSDAGACILINSTEDLYRQRFSAAHEAAHALMDNGRYNVSQPSDSSATNLVEVRANNFASTLLLPPELLRKWDPTAWSNPEKIIEVALQLFVSTPALLTALKQNNLIDEETRSRLRGMNLRLPEKRDPELDGLSGNRLTRKIGLLNSGLNSEYVNLCFDAYANNLISVGKLAETLLVETSELPEIAALFGAKLDHA